MITIKSNREIELMKEAGRIVALAHRKVKEAIRPGISTFELDKIAEDTIRENGATPSFKGYGGFPGSICASINEVVIHGIPKKSTILKNGDIISVDIGACYKGYHGDSAMTYPVGQISEARQRLLDVTLNSLYPAARNILLISVTFETFQSLKSMFDILLLLPAKPNIFDILLT